MDLCKLLVYAHRHLGLRLRLSLLLSLHEQVALLLQLLLQVLEVVDALVVIGVDGLAAVLQVVAEVVVEAEPVVEEGRVPAAT